jgi:hypothetical protein
MRWDFYFCFYPKLIKPVQIATKRQSALHEKQVLFSIIHDITKHKQTKTVIWVR